MYTVLGKFNGETELTDVKSNTLRKFKLTRLPPYIILYMKRFTKNTFYVEKNPTIVNFPIKAVEFGGDLLTEEAKKRYFLPVSSELLHNFLAPSSYRNLHPLYLHKFT